MASSKVNRPTNLKQRDADINQKLQLYGIATAFQNGKLPSNDQIDSTLNSFIYSDALTKPSSKLSTDGHKLVADVREVVNQAKYLLLSKNQGNVLQDFIWQTSRHDYKATKWGDSPVTKDAAKEDGQQALQGLKTLGNLLITNGQFRKLLKDASILFRDMAADGATKVAGKARPSADDLAQIDSAAADNTWHETPDFSKYKEKAQGYYKKEKPADGTEVEEKKRADELKALAKKKKDEYGPRAKEYLDSKMPKDRRDQVILRLKKMVLECQQHSDYQQAIQALLTLAEKYYGHSKAAGANSAALLKGNRSQLEKAENDLKILIERFANGTSTDGLWESIGDIYKAADKDPELKTWFQDANVYLRRCLQEQGYVLEESSTTEWKRLYDRGNYLLKEKYKPQVTRTIDEVKFVGDQFDKDPQNKAFAKSLNRLFKDLGNDENGKPAFKPHLLKDLTSVIIPASLETAAYIPIPRIEYSDKMIDAVVENLVLESDNLVPNLVEIYNNNHVSWGRKMIKAGKNKHAVQVKVAGIQMDLQNISYYVHKKDGFPSITDLGVISILMAGNGLSFQLGLSTADTRDSQHFFKVDKVNVDIDYLKLKVHQSRHKALIRLVKPIVMRLLRPMLQKVIAKVITDTFNKLDATVYDIKKDADRAGTSAKQDPDSPKSNSYKRFYESAKKRMDEDKKKKAAAAKPSDKKLNIAFTMEDSIFPNIKLPSGFSNKASEYKAMALQGEAWQSPVFAIGSGTQSKDVPAAPKIVRKVATGAASKTNGSTTSTDNGLEFSEINPNATFSAATSTVAGSASDAADTVSTAASKVAKRFL